MKKRILSQFDAKANASLSKGFHGRDFEQDKSTANMQREFSNLDKAIADYRIDLQHLSENNQHALNLGKVVLAKVHDNLGNTKIDVDKATMLLPRRVYDDVKQEVAKILNNKWADSFLLDGWSR